MPDEATPRGCRWGFSNGARCPRALLGLPRTLLGSDGAWEACIAAVLPSATTPAAPARRARRDTFIDTSSAQSVEEDDSTLTMRRGNSTNHHNRPAVQVILETCPTWLPASDRGSPVRRCPSSQSSAIHSGPASCPKRRDQPKRCPR